MTFLLISLSPLLLEEHVKNNMWLPGIVFYASLIYSMYLLFMFAIERKIIDAEKVEHIKDINIYNILVYSYTFSLILLVITSHALIYKETMTIVLFVIIFLFLLIVFLMLFDYFSYRNKKITYNES
ncbi:MAG: hypothetical protein U9R16_04400 [Campylobacterota bacterium]|nr:hypothetical protein [Campylobacterota bacterium]